MGHADSLECQEILCCLHLYGQASGQQINFQKSSISFGVAVETEVKEEIKQILNIHQGGAGSYLGLPELFSGSKKELLTFISDKLMKRVHEWYADIVIGW